MQRVAIVVCVSALMALVWTPVMVQGFVSRTTSKSLLLVRNTIRHTTHSSSARFAIGQGWDNENFLNSLSGGSDAMDAANQHYQKHSEAREQRQEWKHKQQQSGAQGSWTVPKATGDSNSEGAEESSGGESDAVEEGQGGSRFKEMMEKGKQAAPSRPGGGPVLYNPMEGIPSASPATPAAASQSPETSSASADSLSMEEQAQLFQKFMQMQQQGGGGGGSPAPAPQKNVGKKQGRNRDADTIANTADLYFAQLKRDSTVRTIARHQGDIDKANAVFEDDGVKELEGMLQTNPYLKDASKDNALLDTSADEMVAVMKMTAGNPEDAERKASSGPSYKQRLAEKKRRGATSTSTTTTEPPKAVVAPIKPQPETKEERPKVVAKAGPAAPVHKVAPAVPNPESAKATPPPPKQPQSTMSSPTVTAVLPTESEDSEAVRRGLRTLMGLILKHRGGPGFGKGRLKGAEAEGFENLLGEITELLRSEAASVGDVAAAGVKTASQPADTTMLTPPRPPATTAAEQQLVTPTPQQTTYSAPVQEVSVPPPPQEQQQQQTAGPSHYAPHTTSSVTSYSSSSAMTFFGPSLPDGRMTRSIACVEGAVQMYKNSPPEIQEGLMVPLRGALMAAVNTCNQIIVEKNVAAAASLNSASSSDMSRLAPHERMTTTIACVEGAVQMYKNSPPEVQESLMVPLLGALMSAVNTCNQIIAEKEVDNVRAYREVVPQSSEPARSAPTTPAQFFEVTPYNLESDSESGEEESASVVEEATAIVAPEYTPGDASVVSTPTGTDENSKFLQKVYDSLEDATGDGKFGLGNLSSEEAAALADEVVEMKAMLIEELDTGIPAASTRKDAGVSPSGASTEGASSKYQQMLAKAKAEKGSKQ